MFAQQSLQSKLSRNTMLVFRVLCRITQWRLITSNKNMQLAPLCRDQLQQKSWQKRHSISALSCVLLVWIVQARHDVNAKVIGVENCVKTWTFDAGKI